MKRFKRIVLLTLVFALLISHAALGTELQAPDLRRNSTDIGRPGQQELVLRGVVKYNMLEGGFFEVDGYRLAGPESYREYEGKTVEVVGVLDTSPSFYMVDAIIVETITILNDDIFDMPYDDDEHIRQLIDERERIRERMLRLEERMRRTQDYINDENERYGEDSPEFRHYREELNRYEEELRMLEIEMQRNGETEIRPFPERLNSIEMLEELVASDGRNVDLEKYRELGRALSTQEARLNIFINGRRPEFEEGVAPIAEEGRTLVPFRAVAESLGAEVGWVQETSTVIVTKGDIKIELPLNDKTAYVNGEAVKLDVAARVVNERTLVPLRFASEALNANVEWISEGQVIVIYYAE